ncbi:succinate dehydrogenase/fumarate reductase flavoprotein subunit [Roseovarius sp. MBR-51]|jgi:succinate dehydrogenase/fumarate reductase flavoprotein subunit
MFHPKSPTFFAPVASPDLSALRQFFEEYQDGLATAAELLAGKRGRRVVNTIMEGLGLDGALTRATWNALRDLLGILTLENVHDEDREEAALFAAIDPADPVVEEICLLSDGLRRLLEAMISEQPETANSLRSAA